MAKKNVKVRDLKPNKDAKGGGGHKLAGTHPGSTAQGTHPGSTAQGSHPGNTAQGAHGGNYGA